MRTKDIGDRRKCNNFSLKINPLSKLLYVLYSSVAGLANAQQCCDAGFALGPGAGMDYTLIKDGYIIGPG